MHFDRVLTNPPFSINWGNTEKDADGNVTTVYAEYDPQTRGGNTPDGRKVKDRPCIELRPIENIRLDGGANWMDPVGTTPYFCDIVPMYVCDVRAMMKSRNNKTGGFGLGLTIARAVIDGHGGTLELGEGPTGGLRVTVSLPRQGR